MWAFVTVMVNNRIIGIVNTNGQNVGTSVLDGVAMRQAD